MTEPQQPEAADREVDLTMDAVTEPGGEGRDVPGNEDVAPAVSAPEPPH
jgi:hypothetical protein